MSSLPINLIKELVKMTDDSKTENKQTQLYGTVHVLNDGTYVQLDGSDMLTPVVNVVDSQTGDRVMVSIENHTATILGNFTYPPSQRDTIHAQETADEALVSAEEALRNANNADSVAAQALADAEDARRQADKAASDAAAADEKADSAKQQAGQAVTNALEAQEVANTAKETVDAVVEDVARLETDINDANTAAQNAQSTANQAIQDAATAKQAADTAQKDATTANEALVVAQETADSALKKADQAQGTADDAQASAASAQESIKTIKDDVATSQAEIDALTTSLETVSNTMEADYARKTDVSETTAHLQSQITQNASQIQSTVSKITEVDETVGKAAEDAQAAAEEAQRLAGLAQAQADTATADAAKAQTAADDAKDAADKAQADAATANQAAIDADAKAAQAAQDLADAEKNLADVTSRVDSTEEEIEAAQLAVSNAQATADQANIDAANATQAAVDAQTTANDAVTNAAKAQTAADSAADAAADAQTTANQAVQDAAKAQADATDAKTTADQAVANALAAQNKANEAAGAAATAQTKADDAANVATSAQNKADEAAKAAVDAQSAAKAADAKAAQAASDLATAEQNLADVTSRVGATEEEIEAAQEAVTAAKKAADDAAADAAKAQTTANDAVTNAAKAQTAADDAKDAADEAQKAAKDAKDAADKAQADADALAVRVTTAETKITQNSDAIKLAATKKEVATTLGGYYTKTETEGLIETTAEEITLSVSENYEKETSKGEQLIVNGNGMMGDNTNFSKWVFDGAVTNDSPGSFTKTLGTGNTTLYSDEYFLISTNNTYTFSLDAKSLLGTGTMYSFIMFYDVDKNPIAVTHHMHVSASTTTLAKELKAGDTVIYLTDASGWSTTISYGFYMTIWNYANSFGYVYPAGTYSRNRVTLPKTSSNTLDSSYIDYAANTITLTSAYNGKTIPAGTSVSQGRDGNTYKYVPLSNTKIPTTWTRYSGTMSGVDYSGNNVSGKFPPGTAYGKLGFLWNFNRASEEQQWITNITVTDSSMLVEAKSYADAQIKVSKDSILSTVSSTYQTQAAMGNYSTTAQMNTAINQKADSILSTVSSTYQTQDAMGNYSTTAQMNSAIDQKANSITSTVSANYATKSALATTDSNVTAAKKAADAAQSDIDNLEIGGRNLLLNTNSSTGADIQIKGGTRTTSGITSRSNTDGILKLNCSATSGEIYYRFMSPNGSNLYGLEVGKTYTVSGKAKVATTSGTLKNVVVRAQNAVSGSWSSNTQENIVTADTDDWVSFEVQHKITDNASGVYMSIQVYYTGSWVGTVQLTELQIEKGTRATAYAPAPDDLATNEVLSASVSSLEQTAESITARVATNEDNIGTLKVTANSLTSTVESHGSSISTLQQTAGSLTSRVESAEGNISTIQQTASGLTLRLDGLSIGGRNLIAGTSLDTIYSGNKGSSSYKDVWSAKTIDIPTGTEYVVSFDAKADVAQTITCYFYSPNTTKSSKSSTGQTGTGADGSCIVTLTTEWKRYWVKWTQTAATAIKSIIVGRTFTADNIYIRAVMFEEGNQPSSWSPAPEDLDSDILAAQNTANTAVSNAAAAQTTATNYLNFSSAGLVVGDMTASTLGRNILIDSSKVDVRNGSTVLASFGTTTTIGQAAARNVYIDSNNVNIRNGSTVLASFGSDSISLAKNSSSAEILLCGETGKIKKTTVLSNDFLTISSDNVQLNGTSTIMHAYASYDGSCSGTYAPHARVWCDTYYGSDSNGAEIELWSGCETKAYDAIVNVVANTTNPYIDLSLNHTTTNTSNGTTSVSIVPETITLSATNTDVTGILTTTGELFTESNIRVNGKTVWDLKEGIFIAKAGYMQIQRLSGSPYIDFVYGAKAESSGRVGINASTEYMEFKYSDCYTFDNSILTPNVTIITDTEATACTITTDTTGNIYFKNGTSYNFLNNVYLLKDASVGGKGYNDGREGIYLDSEGFIQLQRNHDSYHPYIAFFLDSTTTADGMIRVNQSTGYMEFMSADMYTFSNIVSVTGQIRSTASLYLGYGTAYSNTRGIYWPYADDTSHAAVYRSENGLTTYFGWAGSSSYASIGILRGRTVKYSNSSGTTTLSDERLKKDFTTLEQWDAFYDALQPCAFRMINGASGRYHMGFKAGQVERALLDAGLSTNDFAGFIRMPYQPDEDDPEGCAAYEAAGINAGDDELGLIYTEFTALNTYQIQQLKNRVAVLEEKLKELEGESTVS